MGARNTFAATRRSHAILKKLRNGQGVTIEEVSREFNIQYPQARADLKLLEELYDLETRRDGRTKVWEMPGVNTKEAAVSIAAALELGGVALDIFKDTPYGEWIDAHAENWHREVGEQQSERLKRLSSALLMRRNWLPADAELVSEVLEEILDCISTRRGLKINYERSDGKRSDYRLIPRRLIWYQGRLWLQAVDLAGRKEKLFDVGGVAESRSILRSKLISSEVKKALKEVSFPEGLEKEELQAREEALAEEVRAEIEGYFAYKDKAEEDRYFEGGFGIYAGSFESEEVEFLVKGAWAQYLRRYRLHPSQKTEEREEGLEVRLRVGICPEFRSFLLGMIPDVEILKPEGLRDEIRSLVDAWKG